VGAKTRGGWRFLGEIAQSLLEPLFLVEETLAPMESQVFILSLLGKVWHHLRWLLFLGNYCMIKFHLGIT